VESRLLLSVTIAVDPQQDARPISRFIYGANQALTGPLADLTFTRLGGNRWTAYNWENNASNAGSDWQHQNDGYLGGGDAPGGAVGPTLQNASARNAGTLLTIPINGYVAADKLGNGDVRNSGSNYLQTRFRQERASKGAPFSLAPDTTDAYVYQDEFVNWVKANYPHGESDPDRPIWYALDNEPDLWNSTHAAIHPAAATYAELASKSIEYARAIKAVAPGSKVFGPVNYGWQGYVTLQDAPDAAGRDFQASYLQQMKQAEQAHGTRLLDVLDVHWYPEATGNGVRIIGTDTSAAVVAARLQAPRSLWDPTYTETSWITQWSTGGPIRLIPRLNDKIAANYAGTKLAITEYNYGAGGHISGGIAQADALGVFGREGVFAANQWPLASNETFVAAAFQMYRNFDGAGGHFGDTSVRATTSDLAATSAYASTDTANPGVLTVVLLNKTASAQPTTLNLAGVAAGATADTYQLTAGAAAPVYAGRSTVVTPSGHGLTLPAYSVTTIRIASGTTPGNAAPTVTTPASAAPAPVTGTTTNLSVLGADDGGEAGLTYTWTTTGTPPAPVSFSANGTNAAKNTIATFAKAGTYTFAVTISDGSLATTSSVSVAVNQALTSITVSPATATVTAGAQRAFTATARDQFGAALATQPSASWGVAGGGTISSSGLYTAPTTTGSATVRATVGALSGTAAVTIVAPTLPAAPTNLRSTSITAGAIGLAWTDNTGNETGFRIERSLDGRTWAQAGTVGANVTSFTAAGLAANTTYYFRVVAINAAGASPPSPALIVKTRKR
jgi:hypothetical protein